MAYEYSNLLAQAQNWLSHAQKNGWISQYKTLSVSETPHLPIEWFDQNGSRPLIVALMGGTGVGKSSLLNRLAGQSIATAGIERPTSREVTLYHHQSIDIKHLPEQFPMAQIRIAAHNDANLRHLIWIDTPDFDSTEFSNRQMVLNCLPYIDVLIYVVSPDRYRDEKAWRLLLAEEAKHAWLFAFNQWDLGQIAQWQDFTHQLQIAGFKSPLVFKSICPNGGDGDEFISLKNTLISLANDHTIKQLEYISQQVRLAELKQQLQANLQLLGHQNAWQRLPALWQAQWLKTTAQLQQGLAWPLQQAALHYAGQTPQLHTTPVQEELLWDKWAQSCYEDAINELIITANQLDLPTLPLKNQLLPLREQAIKTIQQQTSLAARSALANPGNLGQRVFLKILHVLEIVLPLSAMSWAGYQVFRGYYTSSQGQSDFLGVDFAIHSSLLIALTWLIPFFILKKCQPSLKKSALRGLNRGLSQALNQMENEVIEVIENVESQFTTCHQQLELIIKHCTANQKSSNSNDVKNETLQRMIAVQPKKLD